MEEKEDKEVTEQIVVPDHIMHAMALGVEDPFDPDAILDATLGKVS